jgi:hypothetical protein
MFRFVVLLHEMPPGQTRPTHWDFMLEHGGVLWTWALSEEPTVGRRLAALRLADHRLAYLEYEGEVSGGRGAVTRWDAGHYERMHEEADDLVLRMSGQRISGEVILSRRDPSADQYWFLWKGS